MLRLAIVLVVGALAFLRPLLALARSALQYWRQAQDAVCSLAASNCEFGRRIVAGQLGRGEWLSVDGLAFVLSALAVVLGLALVIRCIICWLDRRFASADTGHGYDSPISSFADDRLSRAAYVDMLLGEILKAPDGQSQVIGIYGAWGEGKTSVVWLLEAKCRERKLKRLRFVWFCPWSSVARKEVNAELFTSIGRSLCAYWHPILALAFLRYASQKTIGWLPRPHGIFELLAFVVAGAMNAFTTFDWVKRQLICKLERLDGRLVVVIDDLDRLEGKEVCEIVRCVKANGDLPNVTYLLLSDEARLARLAAPLFGENDRKRGEENDEFLEKIVTQPLPLWPTSPEVLANEAEKLVRHEFESAGAKWSEVCSEDVRFCLEQFKTLRKIKRLAWSLSANLSYYQASSKTHVLLDLHMGDVLRLTALRLCFPEVVTRLYAFYKNWYEESAAVSSLDGLEMPVAHYEAFLDAVQPGCRPWVSEFMQEVMLVREKANGTQKFVFPYGFRNEGAKASFRLASPVHFERYFNHFELPQSVVPRMGLESFVHALTCEGAMSGWLQAMDNNPLSLTKFLDYFRTWDYPIRSFSLRELIRGVATIVEEAVPLMAMDDVQIARLIRSIRSFMTSYLQRRKTDVPSVDEDCADIVDELIREKRHIVAELLVLVSAGQVEPDFSADDLIFEKSQLVRLWNWVKEELCGKIFDPSIESQQGADTIARLYNEIIFTRSADNIAFFADHVSYLKSAMKMPELPRRLKTIGAYVTYLDPTEMHLVFHGIYGSIFAKHYLDVLAKVEENVIKNFDMLKREDLPVILTARTAYVTPFSKDLDAMLEKAGCTQSPGRDD